MSDKDVSDADTMAGGLALCPGVGVLVTERSGSGPYGALNLSYSVGDDGAAVRRNRETVRRMIGGESRMIGEEPWQVAWLRQVHGATVVYQPTGGVEDQEADAHFTDSVGVALAVNVADCAPVLIADPVARLIGAAHAGRPGMAAGVVPALVEAMARAGGEPERMHAIIGPAICGRCYEVPERMRDEVASLVPGSGCVTRKGTPGIDLRSGIRGQLARLRVATVTDDVRCTAESVDLYSYRRDGRTGRFTAVIWLLTG